MPLYAVFGQDLHCLPMYHKKDARLKWVNVKLIGFVAYEMS